MKGLMKLDKLYITKYEQESVASRSENFKEFGFQHYKRCNKTHGDVCENIHCACSVIHIGDGVVITCGRKKYGK